MRFSGIKYYFSKLFAKENIVITFLNKYLKCNKCLKASVSIGIVEKSTPEGMGYILSLISRPIIEIRKWISVQCFMANVGNIIIIYYVIKNIPHEYFEHNNLSQ